MNDLLLNLLITDYYAQFQELMDSYQNGTFWDSVKVCLSNKEFNNLKNIDCSEDCAICMDNATEFKELRCCRNKICVECSINWFNESVYCPFCKHDLRN